MALPTQSWKLLLPPEDMIPPAGMGRVTIANIRVYKYPAFKSTPIGWRKRDEILALHEKLISPSGPKHNPRWYRITGGYIHSAYIQRIENVSLNEPREIHYKSQLGEITVPYSDSLRPIGKSNWQRGYRLYYGSLHWITALVQGQEKLAHYEITDELLHLKYIVPAEHIRLIHPDEYKPISTHISPENKKILVSLRDQQLEAYEGQECVFKTTISSGIHSTGPTINGIPTDTPTGKFRVSLKMPSKHMGNGEVTSDPHAYELLGVPWTCFFVSTGIAFHGTYWHDNFGAPMSHGCVNMTNQDALWLFRWTSPVLEPKHWYVRGMGTSVIVS